MLFLRRAHSPFIKKYLYKKKQKKQQQQWCEHIIRKNKQIKSTVHDANKKIKKKKTKTKHENKKHLHKSMTKKEALFRQTALVKAANSIK